MSQPSHLAIAQRNAQAMRDAGDDPAARRLLAHTIETAQSTYGKDHPEVLATAHLLARWHREADDPVAARRVLEEALADGQRRWGDADPLMLALSYELGAVAEELGNRHEARRNFARVATAGPAVLGDDHWQVRAARDYLGDPPPAERSGQPVEQPAAPVVRPQPPSAPPPPPGMPPSPTPTRPPHEAKPYEPQPHEAKPFEAKPYEPQPYEAQASAPGSGSSAPTSADYSPGTYPAYAARPVGQLTPFQIDLTPTTQAQPEAPVLTSTRGRGSTVAAAIAAAAAVVAAIVVVVAVLVDSGEPADPDPERSGDQIVAGDPPTEVRLRDDSTSITITWVDPSGGTVPFLVAAGRAGPGAELRPMAPIKAGETTFTIHALNPRLDYCFAVLAVYATDQYAQSGQVCTGRTASASPS